MPKSTRIGIESFLTGFTQGGLFGWAKLPGSPTVICEETKDFAESQFADLVPGYQILVDTNLALRRIAGLRFEVGDDGRRKINDSVSTREKESWLKHAIELQKELEAAISKEREDKNSVLIDPREKRAVH